MPQATFTRIGIIPRNFTAGAGFHPATIIRSNIRGVARETLRACIPDGHYDGRTKQPEIMVVPAVMTDRDITAVLTALFKESLKQHVQWHDGFSLRLSRFFADLSMDAGIVSDFAARELMPKGQTQRGTVNLFVPAALGYDVGETNLALGATHWLYQLGIVAGEFGPTYMAPFQQSGIVAQY